MSTVNFFKKSTLFLALSALLMVTGCKKDDDDQDMESTITEIVTTNPDFSILAAAVVRADLGDVLNNTQNLTVFAPDNEAFAAAGLTLADVQALPVSQLTDILTYHVLTSRIASGDVPAGPNAAVPTFGGENIFATSNSAGVFINGVRVKSADISASNGIIHVVSSVLMPPPGDIVDVASANDDFTYLVAAVTRAGTGIVNALKGTGPLTVFAPTNAAFQAAGFTSIADVQAADPATLAGILTYHVIPSRIFSSDLVNGTTPNTLADATVTINVSGSGASVTGAGNGGNASNIVAANIVTSNGVIHVIDRVLLP